MSRRSARCGSFAAAALLSRPVDGEDSDPEEERGDIEQRRELAQAAVPRLIGRTEEREDADDDAHGQAEADANPRNPDRTSRHGGAPKLRPLVARGS